MNCRGGYGCRLRDHPKGGESGGSRELGETFQVVRRSGIGASVPIADVGQYSHSIIFCQWLLSRRGDGGEISQLQIVTRTPPLVDCSADEEGGSCVYISYHWDSQAKVHLIKELLQQASVSCWSNTTECPLATMNAPAPGA